MPHRSTRRGISRGGPRYSWERQKSEERGGKNCRKSEEQFVGGEILVIERQGENVVGLETKQLRKEESTKPWEPEERSPANKIRKRMQKKGGKKLWEFSPRRI
jgi:hypothetical protein